MQCVPGFLSKSLGTRLEFPLSNSSGSSIQALRSNIIMSEFNTFFDNTAASGAELNMQKEAPYTVKRVICLTTQSNM